MADISQPSSPENTSETGANSSIIYKVRSRVSNILPNSLTKWFSSSDRNGNLRRKHDSETDEEESGIITSSTLLATPHGSVSGPPPAKRTKSQLNVDDRPSTLNTSGGSFADRRTQTPAVNRRKTIGVTNSVSSPYNFAGYTSNVAAPKSTGNIVKDPSDLDTTDEELDDEDMISLQQSTPSGNFISLHDSKRLNIAPMNSGGKFSSSATGGTRLERRAGSAAASTQHYMNVLVEEESNNDELEHDNLNGNANETESDSGESSSKMLALPERSQSSAGRINSTMVQRDIRSPNRYGGGLCGPNRIEQRSGLNFASHLQMHKSLFSDKNMSSSLNNSTTSLNSLNRRQSFNPSIYGSTSALSDSRLLNTNSPFYSGRTMYGGAAAYSRRANSTQRTLRVPTQLRTASSLSTLCSSRNSLASPDLTISALSTTAKRILELINKSTTPLAEVKKMANSGLQQPLLAVKKRIDYSDSLLSRSGSGARLRSPKTPYSRQDQPDRRKSPLTNELQVPSMSQLLQMKKKLQNDTEKVRQLASSSKSILNHEEEYKLPDILSAGDQADGGKQRVKKIRNKVSTVRPTKKTENEDTVEPVNLPAIQFPAMKSIPVIDISMDDGKSNSKMQSTNFVATKSIAPTKPSSLFSNSLTSATPSVTSQSSTQFAFSKPIEVCSLPSAKSVEPINVFKFCEPIRDGVSVVGVSVPKPSILFSGGEMPSTSFKPAPNTTSPIQNVAPLKTGSCLDVLKKAPSASVEPLVNQSVSAPSLSELFKNNNAGKWECSVCMIKNDNSKTKCVSCETAKSAPAPSNPGSIGPPLKAFVTSDTWECPTCLIRNKTNVAKCAACETTKPGASDKLTDLLKPKLTTTDQGFKAIVADQGAKWECPVCMTRNESSRKKCICCEQSKPGAEPESTPAFSFGSAAPTKFNFGVPMNDKPPTSAAGMFLTTSNNALSTSTQPKFTFGVAPTASSSSNSITPTFTFGKPIEIQSKESVVNQLSSSSTVPVSTSKPMFAFGKPAADENKMQAATTVAASSIFGGTAVDKNDNKLANATKSLDTPKSALTPLGGSVFGVPKAADVKPAENPKTESNLKTIVFGSTQLNQPSTQAPAKCTESISAFASTSASAPSLESAPTFTFGSTTLVSSSAAVQSSAVNPPTFSFGNSSSTSSALGLGSTSTSVPSSIVKPTVSFDKSAEDKKGGFAFKPSTSTIATAVETKPAPAASIFGSVPSGGTTNLGKASTSASNIVFGTSTTKSSPTGALGSTSVLGNTSGLGSSAFGAKTSGFTFGANNTSVVPPTTSSTAALSSQSAQPVFLFGSGTNTAESTPKISPFNAAPTNVTNQNTSFFSPNAVTTTTGAFGSSSLNTASVFTAVPPTEVTPNVVPSTASPFSFSSSSNSAASAGGFGQTPAFGQASSNTPLPSFGSFGGPSATPTPSFGTAAQTAQPVVPSFGGFGSTPVPTLNTAPSFGAGVFGSPSTAPSFGATPNTFGAAAVPSNNMFGSPSTSGFGHPAPESSDEPLSKKHLSNAVAASNNSGAPPPYQFGVNNNTVEAKKQFPFSTPNFNFNSNNSQPNPSHPFTFSATATPNAGVFNFGGGAPEASPITPFQFPSDNTNNPFAPQPNTSGVSQQRRKIRAVRRTPR